MAEADCSTKACSKCKAIKPLDDFYRMNSGSSTGRVPQCKECSKTDYYQRNKERILAEQYAKYHARQEPIREAKAKARAEKLASPTKNCPGCGTLKTLEEFGKDKIKGRKVYCKPCHNSNNKKSRERNPETSKASSRNWVKANPEKARAKQREWSKKNPGRMHALKKAWVENNRDRERERYRKLRQNLDFRMKQAVSQRMRSWLGPMKKFRSWDMVNFTPQELRTHLERQFLKGMTWDNYGQWHVDHIRPLSSFKITGPNDPQITEAWDLPNLRPLWAEDNIRKNAKRIFLL